MCSTETSGRSTRLSSSATRPILARSRWPNGSGGLWPKESKVISQISSGRNCDLPSFCTAHLRSRGHEEHHAGAGIAHLFSRRKITHVDDDLVLVLRCGCAWRADKAPSSEDRCAVFGFALLLCGRRRHHFGADRCLWFGPHRDFRFL